MIIAIDINDVLRDYTNQFISMYKKVIDNSFDIEYKDVDDFNFINVFPFYDEDGNIDEMRFNTFKYEDCALKTVLLKFMAGQMQQTEPYRPILIYGHKIR